MAVQNLFKGGFQKSIGVVTGSRLRGSLIVKTKAQPTDRDTIAQEEVRGRFRASIKFFSAFASFAKKFVRVEKKGLSTYNQLVSNNKDRFTFAPVQDKKTILQLTKGTLPVPVIFGAGGVLDFSTIESSFNNCVLDCGSVFQGVSNLAVFRIKGNKIVVPSNYLSTTLRVFIYLVQCNTDKSPIINNCTMVDVFQADTKDFYIIDDTNSGRFGYFEVSLPVYNVNFNFHFFAFVFITDKVLGRQLVSNSLILYPRIIAAAFGAYGVFYNYVNYCIDKIKSDYHKDVSMPSIDVVNRQFDDSLQFPLKCQESEHVVPSPFNSNLGWVVNENVRAPLLSLYAGFDNSVQVFDNDDVSFSVNSSLVNNCAVFLFFDGAAPSISWADTFDYKMYFNTEINGLSEGDNIIIATIRSCWAVDNNNYYISVLPGASAASGVCSFESAAADEEGHVYNSGSVDVSTFKKDDLDHFGVCVARFLVYPISGGFSASKIVYTNADCCCLHDNDLTRSLMSFGYSRNGVLDFSSNTFLYVFQNRFDARVMGATGDYKNTFRLSDDDLTVLSLCDSKGNIEPVPEAPVFRTAKAYNLSGFSSYGLNKAIDVRIYFKLPDDDSIEISDISANGFLFNNKDNMTLLKAKGAEIIFYNKDDVSSYYYLNYVSDGIMCIDVTYAFNEDLARECSYCALLFRFYDNKTGDFTRVVPVNYEITL